MDVIINETGKRESLTLIDIKTGQDMAGDIIGNSGAIGDYIACDADGCCHMDQEDYQWWADYLSMTARYNDQLNELRDKYGPAVDDIIARPELWLGEDYAQHERELQAQIDAIICELGD